MKQPMRWMLAACVAVFAGGAAFAQGMVTGAVKPLRSVQFSPDQDVKCLLSALETGDAATGPSTWILKAPPGCVVPWHRHTAEEQLIIISGAVLAEMSDHPPTRLGPGGFAVMGSQMPHQFSCRGKSPCLMMVSFDRAYDIFWGKGG
jgi:mannose-6-phosphate isomerase-like protein (cupin superfamily)